MSTEKIDWNALEFSCTKEHVPDFDEESETLYQQAKKLQAANNASGDAEMAQLYKRASDLGHHKAMLRLAILYVHGIGVTVDEGKAVDLIERAMKMQSAHAYYLMGVMLQQGVGVRMDQAAALSYFRKSADMGNRYGQAAVGEDLIRAFQRQPEPNRSRGKSIGRKALDCAVSQGLSDAAHFLAVDYLIVENDTSAALVYLHKAAALGSEDSLWRLYDIFDEGKYGISKDPQRASCYYELRKELRADPSKRFPNIDRLCPLPPPPARTGSSGQLSPRVGLWHQLGNPAVMYRASSGDTLPEVGGAPVEWEWEASPFEGARLASGQSCSWPGTWACEDLPVGGRHFEHGETFPEVEGRSVTWRLMPRV
ncbi:TPA: tetratricopeptide repeat protein [Pseudomonas aeruginosa]